MSPEPDSLARQHAVEACGDESVVEGPLQGYHHETYVFPLPGTCAFPLSGGAESSQGVRWKCREPRTGLLWFDRRCFDSEEQLLKALRGRVTSIPDILEVDGLRLQRFVEGHTLGKLYPSDRAVPDVLTRQIIDVFRELARVTPETLTVKRRCSPEDRAENGDTAAFLERLVCFTEERVYQGNLGQFGDLFHELGLEQEVFKRLRKHVLGLTQRPFCLLHADLHRENFIVDPADGLWTIDWELAMLGDPLYELATHLYLMRYPQWQAREVARAWAETVEAVRAGSSRGWQHDLGLLIDYKKAQSVFTDVIREALSLGAVPDAEGRDLMRAGRRLSGILGRAATPLGLDKVPDPSAIAAALERWTAGACR